MLLNEPGPPGCYQLWNTHTSGVVRKATLADGANSTRGEFDNVMARASKKACLSVKPQKDSDAFKPSAPCVQAADSDSDGAILDSVWGKRAGAA